MPVDESYRDLLRQAVKDAGGQHQVADKLGVNQATISRTLKRGATATYTMLMKLSRALDGVPPPIVPVRDAEHASWCRVGSQLAAEKPTVFGVMLQAATEALSAPSRPVGPVGPAAFDRLKAVVADPMPGKRRRRAAPP